MNQHASSLFYHPDLSPLEKSELTTKGYVENILTEKEIKKSNSNFIYFIRTNNILKAIWKSERQSVVIEYDFLSGPYQHLLKTFGKLDLLARAVGASERPCSILDCTFGTGRDALALTKIGCEVTCYERNLENYLLAQDAITRASSILSQLKGTLKLHFGDSQSHSESSQCTYYDPMYRVSKKGKSRKEMEFLHDRGAEDIDDNRVALLLHSKSQRLVIKRPPGAPPLLDLKPTHVFESKGVRFDMYAEQGRTVERAKLD